MQLALDSRTEPIWRGYKRANWANPSTVDSDFVTLRCTSCSLVQVLGEVEELRCDEHRAREAAADRGARAGTELVKIQEPAVAGSCSTSVHLAIWAGTRRRCSVRSPRSTVRDDLRDRPGHRMVGLSDNRNARRLDVGLAWADDVRMAGPL